VIGVLEANCDMSTDVGGWTAIINPDDYSQSYTRFGEVTNPSSRTHAPPISGIREGYAMDPYALD
jgi:hypothetical protein